MRGHDGNKSATAAETTGAAGAAAETARTRAAAATTAAATATGSVRGYAGARAVSAALSLPFHTRRLFLMKSSELKKQN